MPLPRGIPLSTGAAFVTLIALICGLALNGLLQLHTLDTQMRTMVEYHIRKIDLITQTQVAAHTRTDSLFHMALSDDPFERDAHFLAFNRSAFLVGSGRNALRQMGLSPDEQRSFDAQTHLVNNIEAIQEQVSDLLKAERYREARSLLIQKAIPLQDTFNQQLAEMRSQYLQANLTDQRQVRQTYQRTFLVTLIFGLAALALAMLIAWRTLRKIGIKSRQLHEEMAALERSRSTLHEEATHDPLTGLANRRMFFDRLQQAIRHAHRYGGKLGLLYVDLDRFKEINDCHGHGVGDAVLTEVAKRLSSNIRDSDSAARLGGDEFVVLLDGVRDQEDFLAAAHKIDQAVNTDARLFEFNVKIAASIGRALYPDDGTDEDTLMRAADAAMYRAKTGCESARQLNLNFSGG
ncbi:MAG: diguanylate cyclase [Thiobacillus sp.]